MLLRKAKKAVFIQSTVCQGFSSEAQSLGYSSLFAPQLRLPQIPVPESADRWNIQQVMDALHWQNTARPLRADTVRSSRWWCFQTRWCRAWLGAAWEVWSVYRCQTTESLHMLRRSQRASLKTRKMMGLCRGEKTTWGGLLAARNPSFLLQTRSPLAYWGPSLRPRPRRAPGTFCFGGRATWLKIRADVRHFGEKASPNVCPKISPDEAPCPTWSISVVGKLSGRAGHSFI